MSLIAVMLLLLLPVVLGGLAPSVPSAGAGTVRNEYLVVKPDLGGPGYDQFFPQTIVVDQGDQVNITVRNTDDEGFQLTIGNTTTVTINPGVKMADGTVQPVDTPIPPFSASTPGLQRFSAAGHEDMDGYLVVLPSDWTNYNPPSVERKLHILVLPDFAGDGYDKFFPANLVVNEGDNVSISVRNTDDMPHGFAIAAYDIDVAVNPGQDLPNGTIKPLTTAIPRFAAATPGIFRFICTVYCGQGHIDMVGFLVVLPKGNTLHTPAPGVSYRYLTVIPDFAGDGYDKFIPGTMFVTEGDLVYVKIRNTDRGLHGFTLTAYNIDNKTIAPANGTNPTDTYVTPFFATKPGIYEFFCTIYCGPGHYQMIGYLVVLPRMPVPSAPSSAPPVTGGVGIATAVVVGVGFIVVGFIAGLVVARKPAGTNP
jgi:heme/copper-type cytochrome/quinol oxidase subunit 2